MRTIEEKRAYSRDYMRRKRIKNQVIRKCKVCATLLPSPSNFQFCANHRGPAASQHRQSQKKKAEVHLQYGSKCAHCAFQDIRALQLDHVAGGGVADRKARRAMHAIYQDALDNPDKYQLLCANCNWIKRITNNEVQVSKYR